MNKHDLPVITDLSLPVGDEAKNKQNSPEQFQSPSLVDEIKLLRSELSGLRMDMTNFTAAIHEFNKRLGDVEARLLRLESQDMQASSEHTSAASSDAIAKLEARLNQSEQENLLNDVEVTGVVESSNENPIHVVITLAQKIGVELSEHDIVSAKRVGLRRNQNTIQSSNITSKPRAIVVRLSRRHLRDELLRAARVRRGADTAEPPEPEWLKNLKNYIKILIESIGRQNFKEFLTPVIKSKIIVIYEELKAASKIMSRDSKKRKRKSKKKKRKRTKHE
ncbi:unnamed protein product [Colias eurytheme]|nr:unnamed protein product [Colias eurytheme]